MARYNQNSLGRFTSFDTLSGNLGNPQSLNHYPYALNDPVNLADSTGQDACDGSSAPVCNQATETDAGGGTCTLDGISIGCGSINQQDAVQCPNNACQTSTTTYATLNGIIVASYTQVWDFSAFANDAGYYAESGPGAMFFSADQAGQAAGEYFGSDSVALNREFSGRVLAADSEGFFSFDLEGIGPVCSGTGLCVSHFSAPVPGDVADWHTHPHPGDVGVFIGDRIAPSVLPDYVTQPIGSSFATFRISPWPGGIAGQLPSLQAGPGALNYPQIAQMCQVSSGPGIPGISPCH